MVLLLLTDSRLALHWEAYQAAMIHEILKVDAASSLCWEWLGSLLPSMSKVQLQDTVLSGCLNSFAYVMHKTFSQLQHQPWSLAHGDVHQNVCDLLAGELDRTCPWTEHLFALGSQNLMSAGKLEAALRTLLHASFSAFHVEKMHASVALVRKFHPEVTTG
eukprot:3179223-Amphidinium_carterae.1